MSTENTLDAFEWDTEIDFFGETVQIDPSSSQAQGKTKVTEKGPGEEKESTDEDPFDFMSKGEDQGEDFVFETPEDLEEPAKEGEKGKKGKSTSSSSQGLTSGTLSIKALREKGILDFEDEELDSEDFNEEEFFTSKLEESLENRVEELISNLPDTVKNLIRYATNGGDVNQMITEIASSKSTGLSVDMDMSNESNQEAMVRHMLKSQGFSDNYIETNIEYLKDTEKLSDISSEFFEKWKKEEASREQSRVEEQKRAMAAQREKAIQYKKDLENYLSQKPKINSIGFTRNEIRELPSYMVEATVKTEDGRLMAPFYRDLSESLKDRDKALLLAKIVKSDFNMSDIKKYLENEISSKVTDNIRRTNTENKNKGGSSHPFKRSLVELID